MFDVHCPRHGSTVLLGYSNIASFANTDRGIEVRFRCYCGYEGTWVTGARVSVGTSTPTDQCA
jgi:hypothetical protein